MEQVRLLKGDNRELLKTLETNSVDSVVSDPPYGLSFMNKKWDYDVPSVELWKEVLRVLKPGGHVLSFGGTRTYHRMVVNMEDAGFEIRDSISYMYGSGFPKSHNIGKAVKKLNGSDDFDGIGTALKPSMELICLARKPLSEKSIAENVLKHGTGGINIDDCRVESNEKLARPINEANNNVYGNYNSFGNEIEPEGRFPANTILECICDEVIPGDKGEIIESSVKFSQEEYDMTHKWGYDLSKAVRKTRTDTGDIHTNPECPCYILDKQSGVKQSTRRRAEIMPLPKSPFNSEKTDKGTDRGFDDKGGASRFFYTAKVSKKERNMGLDEFDYKEQTSIGSTYAGNQTTSKLGGNPDKPTEPKKNNHPTVKPINLMTYLCRLITPPNGVILDMYMGSGSTGISALIEGFNFIGMEMDEDYFNIAEARINNYEQYRQFKK